MQKKMLTHIYILAHDLLLKEQPTLSSQVKAVSGRLSGERLGGRSCADARGAVVASAMSVASAIVGEMLGEMWRCLAEASGAIRAANRQRTENIRVRG